MSVSRVLDVTWRCQTSVIQVINLVTLAYPPKLEMMTRNVMLNEKHHSASCYGNSIIVYIMAAKWVYGRVSEFVFWNFAPHFKFVVSSVTFTNIGWPTRTGRLGPNTTEILLKNIIPYGTLDTQRSNHVVKGDVSFLYGTPAMTCTSTFQRRYKTSSWIE